MPKGEWFENVMFSKKYNTNIYRKVFVIQFEFKNQVKNNR